MLLDVYDVEASQVDSNKQLAPLLFASNMELINIVENLIKRKDFAKEKKIDALELLGASIALSGNVVEGFGYLKRGMEERFKDPALTVLTDKRSALLNLMRIKRKVSPLKS